MYQVKECSVLCMYGKMQASGLTGFNFSICSSAIWGQPCFPAHLKGWQVAASCFPPAPQPSPWGVAASPGSVLGALIHIWRPEIIDGCDISHLLIWQEIFSFHKLMEKTQSCLFFSEMSHHLFLTCSWSPDFCVGFKVGICWWERMDTAFLILLKCSWVN